MTRQQRRAAAREKAKSLSIDRVDPALMQLLVSAQADFTAGRRKAMEAQAVISRVSQQIAQNHNMKAGDELDPKTGQIIRAPKNKKGKR